MNNNEKIDNKEISKEQPDFEKEDTQDSDTFIDEINKIDEKLKSFNTKADSPEEIQSIQEEREREYENEISKLDGINITEETKKEIYNNMVNDVVEQATKENQEYDELLEKRASLQVSKLFNEDKESAVERLDLLRDKIGEKDYKIVLDLLKSNNELFDRKDHLLHATNSFALKNMRDLNKVSGGLWQKGASFTDGGSDIALSFNLMWEDLKTNGGSNPETNIKKINGNKYGNPDEKKDDFVNYLLRKNEAKLETNEEREEERKKMDSAVSKFYKENWDIYKDSETFEKEFNDKLYGELIPQWKEEGKDEEDIEELKEEFIERGETFKKISTNRPPEDEIENMFGATLAINKNKIDANKEELHSGQAEFEVRSKGEVDFDNVDIIFVPMEKMDQAKELIGDKNIEIRASEELETIRMLEKNEP